MAELFVINMTYNSSSNNETEPPKEPFYEFVHALYLYLIPVISSFGILGNACSFKVFISKYFSKQTSSVYLTALSISDALFLAALFLGWLGSLDDHALRSGVLCMVAVYVTYVTSFLSVWCVVLIMVERYLVVCHTLKGPRFCSKTRAIVVSVLFSIFAVLFYLYCFFTNKITENLTGPMCTFKRSYIDVLTVFAYIDTAITVVIPFVLILILNVCVLFTIRRFKYRYISNYEKKYYAPPHNCLSKAQFKLTVMLIIVSTVLLVLNLPSHGIRFYIIIYDLVNEKNVTLFLWQQLCQILYYSNFAINFLLYFSRSKSFRRNLAEPLKCSH